VRTSDFDYILPEGQIAQCPIEPRDSSRLLMLDRNSGKIKHRLFRDLPQFLYPGDILIMNDSRVIPARLFTRKIATGGNIELLLLRRDASGAWEALIKPARRVLSGSQLEVTDASGAPTGITVEILKRLEEGIHTVRVSDETALSKYGQTPLPPYIHQPLTQPERYQTVYARENGSAAAPTAGLHFTPRLLDEIAEKGIRCHYITLHIGLDTFRPVKVENPAEHPIHREYAVLDQSTVDAINNAKENGGRVVCVGTSAVRTLEYAARQSDNLKPFHGWVELLILPGFDFKVTDVLITNFHLPRSTPLLLASAFSGWDKLKPAYKEAITENYRFYSFGDAMLIL